MKRGWFHWGVGSLTTYHLLACFLVYQTSQVSAGSNLRTELRTKLLLSNIRSHLAKQVDEVVQQKECDSGLILCESPKAKEASPETESDEIPPPPKIRGLHKPAIKVNPKDVIQNMIHKVHKPHVKKEREHEPEKLKPTQAKEDDDDDDNSDVSAEKIAKKPKKIKKDDDDDDSDVSTEKISKKPKEVKVGKEVKETQTIRPKSKKKKQEPKQEEGIRFPNTIPIFSATSSAVQSELCRKHSRLFLRQLERYKMWALLMYDASAKLPSGILQGNVNQFGDFDECLTVNAVLKDKTQRKDNQGIQGRYCLAAIDIEATADEGAIEQVVERAQAYGFLKSSADDAGHFVPRFTTINWGVCVPSSCSPKDVERALSDELLIYNETAGVQFTVLVDEDACVDREDLDIDMSIGLICTLLFYVGVVTIAVIATYRDLREPAEGDNEKEPQEENKQGKLQRLLMAFSWKRNAQDLFSDRTDDEISCVHGIKALFTIMLYVAHKTAPLAFTPYHNRVQLTKLSNEPASTLLRTSIIYTDSFLLVSGMLFSFNLTREALTKGKVEWLRRLIARIVRLTPPLLAVVLFYSYVSDQLGSGPQWEPLVGKNAQLCRESGWKNLLYVQNFFNFEQMCAPQTHQLALDMQLSLTAPLLVFILYHYDLLGVLILQAIFLLSSAMRYIVTSNNALTLVFYHGATVSQLYETANLLYIQAIYRATPYVLGVTIGYYLQKQGSEIQEKLQKPIVAMGWILASCLAVLSFCTPVHLASRNYVYDAQEAAQYAAMSPISWSLALGWLIAACHLGFGGKFNDFLSCKPLVIFSRMSYSVYLTQFLVFNYNVGIIRTPKYFTITEALDVTEISTILSLSFVVTLLFDIPMKEIKTILLERSKTLPELEADTETEQETDPEPENQPEEPKNEENPEELAAEFDGPTFPPGYEDEDDLEGTLRRSSRVRFDEDEDPKFWIDPDQQEESLEEEEAEASFWGNED